MNSQIKGLGRQTARLLAFLAAVTCGGALAQTNVGPSQSFRYLSESGTNVVLAAGATFVNSTSSLGTIEGATDDAFEATISVLTDPTADVTISVPSLNSGVLLISTLTTNDVNVANSVWAVSNGVRLEGAAANDHEGTLSIADLDDGDVTYALPDTEVAANDVDEASVSLVVSTLDSGAGDPGDAGVIYFGSSSMISEGATANTIEQTIAFPDPVTPDSTITFPDGSATADNADADMSVAVSTVNAGLNDPGDAAAVWLAANGVIGEGAAADGFEGTLAFPDVTGDVTWTLPLTPSTTLAGLAVAQTFTANQTFTADILGDGSDQFMGMLHTVTASTTVALTAAQCGSVLNNDSADVMTLPEASTVIGCQYIFTVSNAANFDVNPADATDIIRPFDDSDGGVLISPSAGDAIRCAVVGGSVTLVAVDADSWIVIARNQDWADVN